MAEYYEEILRLCGFESIEMKKEKDRIEKVFQKLELGPKDMKKAVIWVNRYHDVSLLGVRKILRLWIKELIDMVLARDEGKKILYYGFPTITGPAAAIMASSEDAYCCCPDTILCYTMGQIFNKLTPILEAGEENGLPPGHSLCSLQQVRVGGMAKGIIPVADMVTTSSYNCDMGSKADELLHQKYGHRTVYIDGSMDSEWGEWPNYLSERQDFLGSQLEKIFEGAHKYMGINVTEQARREGAARSVKYQKELKELIGLMRDADPQPLSIVDVEVARRLGSGSASNRFMVEGPEAISVLVKEVKDRISKGIGVVEKGAPRIMILMAHFSDPSIMRMMEECGLSIPTTAHTLFAASAIKQETPLISGERLATDQLKRGPFHSAYGEIKPFSDAAQHFNVDGVIWNYLYNCRPLSILSHLLKQYIEKETKIPVLSLEMDMYDSRNLSASALQTRVETFAEMLRSRKASRTVS